LNDKEQLGGPKGSKIKLPIAVDSMASLQPVSIVGGSKSLFIVTQSGKVRSISISLLNLIIISAVIIITGDWCNS